MLEIKGLEVFYPKAKKAALSNISLSFEAGEFVCILGKSGAGKSTLIRTINHLQVPSKGKVIWKEKDLHNLNGTELRQVRSEMGMVFQHFNLIPRLTVFQNVLTGMFNRRTPLKNILGIFSQSEKNEAEQVIRELGLADFIFHRVEELSGGQKQRVGIARSLLQRPKVLLGDEPVASLDPGTAHKIMELIKTLHNKHDLLTIINVHDVSLAIKYATRIIALKEGEVIFNGSPESFDQKVYEEVYGPIDYLETERLPVSLLG